MTSKKLLSQRKTEIRDLIQRVNELAFRCAHGDTLIRGTPGEVYRTCGSDRCNCKKDSNARHGPYMVVQVFRDGKQSQIALRQEQRSIWEKAKHYQQQIEYLQKLRKTFIQLETIIKKTIQERTEDWP